MLFLDLNLARRLEAGQVAMTQDHVRAVNKLRPETGAEAVPIGSGHVAFTGFAPVNRAEGLGMNGPVAEEEIAFMEEFLGQHGAPFQVEACPLADPTLFDLLGQRGYRVSYFRNIYVRGLNAAEVFPAAAQGVTVTTVSEADATAFSLTVGRGFKGDDDVEPSESTNYHMNGVTCYLARLNGEPAGGGCMSVRDGVAYLFGTSTRTQFRGRGVQTALLHARLTDAIRAGAEIATVSTVPGSASQRNVMRVGFQTVYTKITLRKDWQ